MNIPHPICVLIGPVATCLWPGLSDILWRIGTDTPLGLGTEPSRTTFTETLVSPITRIERARSRGAALGLPPAKPVSPPPLIHKRHSRARLLDAAFLLS